MSLQRCGVLFLSHLPCHFLFFFNDTATTEIYTLSLHDALPISPCCGCSRPRSATCCRTRRQTQSTRPSASAPKRRSEEHTSELQSQSNLVCRLLLEKKKTKTELERGPRHSRIGHSS